MDFIYSLIGKFLGWLDGITGSYVWALFIFAILVELLMLPFGIRQQKNSIKQAKLRPKEMAIRKKYAGRDDQPTQQKMMQEIQELYQQEGYNPLGGCLPLLIQFPIIIILYNTVINPLRHIMGMTTAHISGLAEFVNSNTEIFGQTVDTRNTISLVNLIKDTIAEKGIEAFSGLAEYTSNTVTNGAEILESLTKAVADGIPNFSLFGANLAVTPSLTQISPMWIVPILTFAVYFASMKLNRKLSYQPAMADNPQMGCSNNVMDITMPLMSVWISFMVPAVIGVYWIFKSILTTLKQFIVTRVMPLPRFTEEDYRAAEREMKGKGGKPVTRNYVPSGTKPRSLHHIDDEDEELPAAPKAPAKKAEPSALAAPLKEDDKPAREEKPEKKKKQKADKVEATESDKNADQPTENTDTPKATDAVTEAPQEAPANAQPTDNTESNHEE